LVLSRGVRDTAARAEGANVVKVRSDAPSDRLDSVACALANDGREASISGDIDSVLAAIGDARRTADEAIVRLRDQGAEKLILDAVGYTRDELAVAEKRLVQRTMFAAAQGGQELVA